MGPRKQSEEHFALWPSVRWRWGLAIAAVAVLGACSRPFHLNDPSADGPTISALELVPARTAAGCPLTVRFHFEAPHGPVARAHVEIVRRLRRAREPRRVDLPVDAAALGGKPAGDVEVPVSFVRPGKYWYYVQVEDDHGRQSNVLEGGIVVDGRESGTPAACPS